MALTDPRPQMPPEQGPVDRPGAGDFRGDVCSNCLAPIDAATHDRNLLGPWPHCDACMGVLMAELDRVNRRQFPPDGDKPEDYADESAPF